MADIDNKPKRIWRIVLVCSLALNLAVAGVIGGTFMSGRIGDGPPRNFDLGLGPIARALLPQERRAIGRELRRDRDMRGIDPRGRVADMVHILNTTPFDADAFRMMMSEQSIHATDMQARALDALVVAITDMSDARRADFATRLAEEMSRSRMPNRRPSGG